MSTRVVFFADRIAHWRAGTEGQLLLLATELADRGYSVPLYVFASSDAATDGRWPDSVSSLRSTRISSPVTWWRVFKACRNEVSRGATVTHCFFNDSSIVVPLMSRIAGLSTIVSRRDMGFWYTPAKLKLLRIVRRFVSAVVANCEAVRTVTCRSEGYRADVVEVIYNGLGRAQVSSDQARRDEAIIGVVANIRPIKRLEDAVRAFEVAHRQFPDARLRIIGGGNVTSLQRLAEELGIAASVEFAGQTSDPAGAIAKFSVALLTSESEGLSNAIIEYMHAGKAVICTRTGGNTELVQNNETGLLVSVGDVEGIGAAIASLLAEEETRDRLGRAAQARIKAMCSTETMVSSFEDLYSRVSP